ncbi:hypothetical protein, partial [[Kitasatospora] papulosa]|uniref:hypothetical protein n=1 Tax=[Kitasatospora] papulosa TaxID=1464011 RepID=UPI003685686F
PVTGAPPLSFVCRPPAAARRPPPAGRRPPPAARRPSATVTARPATWLVGGASRTFTAGPYGRLPVATRRD